MSHATFTTNRDFFIEGADAKITEALVTLFEEDEKGEKSSPLAEGLILASFNGRTMLERLIESAQKNILIYAENFSDERIATLLETKKKAGVSIAIVMTDPKSIRDNATFIQRFHDHGIRVCAPKKPYIHAKMTLIDQRAVLIGSMNFSANSIDNNREVSLLFAPEKTALETLIKTFNTDCQLEFRLN
jgi:phosphatidylserine/phosphatidylglycerophosphate/cardiolipin synthase-like enzyme